MSTSSPFNETFYNVIDDSPMPIAIYGGREMIIKTANQAMLKLWGKEPSVIGKTLKEALPELEGQPFHGLLDHVYMTGETYEAKEDKVDLVVDGRLQTFYFTFTYKALRDANGKPEAIINTAAEVTELVLARKKIAETKEQLSFALAAAEVGTWDLDPLNNLINWDTRCKELFGFFQDEEVTYADVLKYIHPDDAPRVQKAVAAAIDPSVRANYDIRFRTIGHSTSRYIHCKGRGFFNEDGQAYRFSGTARDITGEIEAHRREQQLLTLIDLNAEHMSIADMEGNLVYLNEAAKKLLGIDEGTDITTLNAIDFYSPEELDRVQNTILNEISSQNKWQGTIKVRNLKTKEIIPANVNYILIRDPNTGEVIGRGATVRDLRPEIKAQSELQRLATIVDISEDFCNYCDLEGNTLYINEAGRRLISIDEDKISSTNMLEYHSESSSELIKNEIVPKLLSEGKWSGTLELINQQTREIIPIHKQLFIIRDSITDKPVAFAGIARDLRKELNARREIDQKNSDLHSAVKELEFLANSVPAVVWTSDPDGKLDYINQRWNERSAKRREEALVDGWMETIHADDREEAIAAWEHSVKSGKLYEIEFRLLDKEGQYRWWLVRAEALRDSAGNIIKWYGSNTDITEQKELQRQKDNFLGVASHELKTPVTSIKAYAQVMETLFRRSGDAKNADLVAKMDKQINRLNSLILDLLDVTKITTGRLQFNNEPFNFNLMVEEVIEEVQRTTGRHEIKKRLGFEGMVVGDRDRICQVLTNLLTNAIKYSPEANEVIVYTEDHGNDVQLCVQDFGIGISRDQKDKVFEQFYRVSGTREHTFPGLGLGLYISSEIVRRLGGRIWVNSVVGKGSTFCFSIPVQQRNPKNYGTIDLFH